MKTAVIKEMTTDELKERLVEERKQLAKLHMSHAVNPLDNPGVIGLTKKTVARIMTELRNRELEIK
ncbi:MAG: 50S ribosomal protein L29 [Bacteroidetes bacterium HGW-Bacteroidetes-6]|jgi:large subunit ribosomal protein L29|nr:MAG: 50S ribosomal protein L29 [Bacteroidetes bacterium HGW-Bacteroidetes-6]